MNSIFKERRKNGIDLVFLLGRHGGFLIAELSLVVFSSGLAGVVETDGRPKLVHDIPMEKPLDVSELL